MPQPTSNDVHVDGPLTNISVAYMQDHGDYIADRLFPVIPVTKQSDRYFLYKKGDWFRDEAKRRAPGAESAGGGYSIDNTPSYYADVWAYHKDVDAQVAANTDDPLDAFRDATQFVTEKMLLKREVVFLAGFFAVSLWTGSTTGGDITPGTKWDVANSTPIEDVEAQQFKIKSTTGKWPNRFVLGANAYKAVKNHAEILDRLKYTQRGVVTPQLLAAIFAPPATPEGDSVDFQVLVAAGVKNSAAEGATDSIDFMATKTDALLCYAEPNPGIQKASAGYIFSWTGYLGASAYGSRIARIPTPLLGLGSERVEGELAFACKLVAADLGAYFSAATS